MTYLSALDSASTAQEAQLFDSTTIDSMVWPDNELSKYTQKYIHPIIKNGIHAYVENIYAEMFVLKIGELVFPVIVANEGLANSYICSPYEHYISYGREATSLIDSVCISFFVTKFLNVLAKVGKVGRFSSVVYVNHWLFSTDLYPKKLSEKEISIITSFLCKKFPTHAIVMRSMNRIASNDLQNALKKAGYYLVASRQVYLTDTKKEEIFKTRIIKSDMKLWRESAYKIVDGAQLSTKDCPQMLHFYNKLYIHQHSNRNPKYNLKFIEHLFNLQLLQFKVLTLDGQIKGVAGFTVREGLLMCPFFGYDKTDPEHNIIYRMLNTALFLEAKQRGLIFHQSAGASFYKSIRRAESCLESMAIFVRHLPLKQKAAWTALKVFINAFAPPYMRKY